MTDDKEERTSIRSKRLNLVPMTPQFLRATLTGDTALAAKELGASLPDDWPDVPSVIEHRLKQLDADPALQPWLLRAMCLRATGAMIGHIGFHTAPGPSHLEAWSPGGVEFGCTVYSGHRRQGYAREAALALMQWAHDVHGVIEFVVTVGRGNAPSLALATGLGFRVVGSHVDEVDGVEDVLVRTWSAASEVHPA